MFKNKKLKVSTQKLLHEPTIGGEPKASPSNEPVLLTETTIQNQNTYQWYFWVVNRPEPPVSYPHITRLAAIAT